MDEKYRWWIPPLNYEKSIRKEKLVYDRKSWVLFDYLKNTAIIIFILFATTDVVFNRINENGYFPVLVALLVDILVIVNFCYFNKLVKIEGLNILRNKEDVMNTLKEFYDDLTFDASETNVIRDVKLVDPFGRGRMLTILLKDNLVYFNRTNLITRANSLSTFSALVNYYRCKEIVKRFQEIQRSHP